jgi:hypothetical protein
METSYAQSLTDAKIHGKAFLKTTIGAHPVATAVTMALLVVLVLVLGFYVAHYRAKCSKSSFHAAPLGNLDTGNRNPLWQYGSMDAGNWGPMHREPTAYNMTAYNPRWRAGQGQQVGPQGASQVEGLASSPGEPAYSEISGCGQRWDSAASAEASALASIGGLDVGTQGERQLQHAGSAAFDSNVGLSDDQLTTLMHQGGAP